MTLAVSLCIAEPAFSLSTVQLADDLEMLARIDSLAFVAEGRIGDLGGAATFELDIGPTTAAPADTEQFPWVSGMTENWTLSFAFVGSLASLTISDMDPNDPNDPTVSFDPGTNAFSTLWIRLRAADPNTQILLENVALDGEPLGVDPGAAGPGGLQIWEISGGNLSDGFDLLGDVTLTFDPNSPPSQSALAFQVKVGTPVPEPGGALLLGAGLLGIAGLARRFRGRRKPAG